MKILAIDFGMKRMGFALGNTDISTAVPIDPIAYKNTNLAIEHIEQLITGYDITQILIGCPLNMDGTKSSITQQVEHFTRRLKKTLAPGIPIQYVDERLSSFEAEEELKPLQAGYKKRKKYLDSMSALVILRRFMEEK
jgi:putative Holliday junction resolvase